VPTGALRATARSLDDCAHRLAHGLAVEAGLTVDAPQWAAAGALTEWESTVHGWFGSFGARVADTGDAVRRAADAYDAADERAAHRLTRVPR
jgi:hypothetical protein